MQKNSNRDGHNKSFTSVIIFTHYPLLPKKMISSVNGLREVCVTIKNSYVHIIFSFYCLLCPHAFIRVQMAIPHGGAKRCHILFYFAITGTVYESVTVILSPLSFSQCFTNKKCSSMSKMKQLENVVIMIMDVCINIKMGCWYKLITCWTRNIFCLSGCGDGRTNGSLFSKKNIACAAVAVRCCAITK